MSAPARSEDKPTPAAMRWTGRAISVLPALMLLFSAYTKLVRHPMLVEGFPKLGWPLEYAFAVGIAELVCTILYLIPQTAVLGAILLTGYLGGAIATHARLGEDFTGPVIFGVLIWLGVFLRDRRLRSILPWRSLNG